MLGNNPAQLAAQTWIQRHSKNEQGVNGTHQAPQDQNDLQFEFRCHAIGEAKDLTIKLVY